MPLLPTTLVQGLLGIDDPSPPQSPPEVGQKWFKAWWPFISASDAFTPAVLGLESAISEVFVPLIAAASLPVPVPLPFFLALEAAMRASIALLGTPATLLPPGLSIIPAPAPLAPLLLPVVVVGLASPVKPPPRILMGAVIYAWTLTHLVANPAPPPTPFT